MEEEIWKEYPEQLFDLKILISNLGRVKCNSKIRKPSITKNGYSTITFKRLGEIKTKYLHRIIAETFIENGKPDLNKVVNHIDGNKDNNSLSNLEWTTSSENNKHAYDNNLKQATYNRRVVLLTMPSGETKEFEAIRFCAQWLIDNLNDGVSRKLASVEGSLTKVLNGRLKGYLKHKLNYLDNE